MIVLLTGFSQMLVWMVLIMSMIWVKNSFVDLTVHCRGGFLGLPGFFKSKDSAKLGVDIAST